MKSKLSLTNHADVNGHTAIAGNQGVRLLIVEEALRNHGGHWYEYNRGTKAAVQSVANARVEMLGNVTMEPSVAQELDAVPYFRYTVWDQIYNHPQAWKRYGGVLIHNFRLYQDLLSYFQKNQSCEIVFAPTVVLHHFLGYHAIARRFAGKSFRQLVLLVRNNIAVYDSAGTRSFRSTALFWKFAIKRFKPLIRSGLVRFVTDSERLADEYEELTGIRFQVLPHPSLVGNFAKGNVKEKREPNDSIRIFLPGPSRYEKGTDRLLDAVEQLKGKLQRPIEITLQWSEPFVCPDGTVRSPDDAVSPDPMVRFRVHRKPLSSEDYSEELSRCDFVILPYRLESYFARISGVAVEAMLLSKPLIYTENTWVGTIAEQFGLGIAIRDDVHSIAECLLRLETEGDTHAIAAADKMSDVAEFFSAQSFCQRLMGKM